MATIIKEAIIDAPPEDAWAALRDFGAVHERLVPGFVVDCRLDEDGSRVVTFFNGAVAREILVGVDESARRLAYAAVEGPLGSTHHNASAQVLAAPDGATRFVWTTDVLPDAVAPIVDQMMARGIAVISQTLAGAATTAATS
jgi:carbon monoxide dehydrogenase subunit G